jgi:hypothetical protein
MLTIDDVVKAIQEELIPKGGFNMKALEEYMLERWGSNDETYSVLSLVVKSYAEYSLKSFDDLPSDLRERLSASPYNLDQAAILDYYSMFGESATMAKITSMEAIAKRVLEEDFWKSLGKTPFAKFQKRAETYAEAVAAREAAGREAVRRQNEARARADDQR